MSINLTDELLAKTKKGKIASAKQVLLDGDQENLQQIGEKTHQLEDAIKDISVSGGASTATAVSYNNETSGMTAVTAQGAIDELAAKNKTQDATIDSKAEKSEVATELDKKFDKENIAQEFGDSKDKVVSQFALPFREIESPEFIKAIVDAEDHFLLGIQLDGSIEWGKGIPAPIRTKLQEIITQCQQDKTDLLGSINIINGILDKTTIKDEAGEIQDTPFRVIENEEFLWAVVDSEDKVLLGIYRATGKPYYPFNEMYHVEQNEEYFALWLDAADHVLLGIRRDGEIIGEIHAVNALKQVISQLQADLASLQEKVGTIDTNLKELLDVFSLQENPEYLAVEKDADGRVLSATNPDGSHYIHNAKSETIPTEFEHIEDPEERMEVTTDVDGKVIGYRDSEGNRHETNLSVENLSIGDFSASDKAVDKFNSLIKKPWKTVDWSNETDIHLPLPRFAIFNIICSKRLGSIDHKVGMIGFKVGENCEIPAKIQFSDLSGNYFEKDIIFSAQGSSSMLESVKNHSIDFTDGSSVKFGDWVPMDAFHIKKYFVDVFRGQSVVAYRLAEQVMQSRPWSERRGYSYLDASNYYEGDADVSNAFNTSALCHPDGFPVEMYYNGEYVGLYAWTLKKHRSNYNMSKKENKKIIIDGVSSTLWSENINWKQFELKNPKKLYYTDYDSLTEDDVVIGGCTYLSAKHAIDKGYITKFKEVDGKKFYEYDGDYADEICGEESVDKGVSKNIKDYILGLHNFSKDNKETFSEEFNVPLLIDYLLFSQFTYNQDGIVNNVVWTSYDLKKLCPNFYDLDTVFGAGWGGSSFFLGSQGGDIAISGTTPFYTLQQLFTEELQERYKELRDLGIFTTNNVVKLFTDWVSSVGYDRLTRDIDNMKAYNHKVPSFSDTFHNSIGRIEKWTTEKIKYLDKMYNYK